MSSCLYKVVLSWGEILRTSLVYCVHNQELIFLFLWVKCEKEKISKTEFSKANIPICNFTHIAYW